MVFYNKPLRAYVLIELKTIKLLPEAVGQLNMYLNYYAAEVNEPDDTEKFRRRFNSASGSNKREPKKPVISMTSEPRLPALITK